MEFFDQNTNALFYAREKLDFMFNFLEGYEFGIGGGSVLKHIYKYIHREDMPYCFDADLSKMADIDIFPSSHEEAVLISQKLQNEGFIFLEENPTSTNRKYFHEGERVDLVCPNAFLGKPEKILKFFDCAQCSFMVTDQCGYYLENAFECVENKQLMLNFVNNQFFNILRIYKYIRKGFELQPKDELFLSKSLAENGEFYFHSGREYAQPGGDPTGVFPNGERDVLQVDFEPELLTELWEKRM